MKVTDRHRTNRWTLTIESGKRNEGTKDVKIIEAKKHESVAKIIVKP